MTEELKRLNSWFYRHGWHRDNRGYEQYIWKEQLENQVSIINGKEFRLIQHTVILVWPGWRCISVRNYQFWRAEDGEEIEYQDKYKQGTGFRFTPEEFEKINELYNLLDSGLKEARSKKEV